MSVSALYAPRELGWGEQGVVTSEFGRFVNFPGLSCLRPALAAELGVADSVTFRGHVDREALLARYRESDLFILASRATPADIEGFGIVFIEASAAGVPVICSAEGGATDAVEDGRNGLLLPSSSPEAIAAGIRRFLAMRHQLTFERVQGYAQQFRWPRVARAVLTQLDQTTSHTQRT